LEDITEINNYFLELTLGKDGKQIMSRFTDWMEQASKIIARKKPQK
jgi:hypothetical protein